MGNCCFQCFNSKPLAPDPYAFKFSSQGQTPENANRFESNKVRTSKYTLFSFLPRKHTVTQWPSWHSSRDWLMSTF